GWRSPRRAGWGPPPAARPCPGRTPAWTAPRRSGRCRSPRPPPGGRETIRRRGDCPPRLESNSNGARCAPPLNGERSNEDFILASLVPIASPRQADRPGLARPTAAAAPPCGGAGGSCDAVADAAAGPGHRRGVVEPVADGGDRLDHLLRRGRWRAWLGAVEERRYRGRHHPGQGHPPWQRQLV